MARRRAARAIGGGLVGALHGVDDVLGLAMRQQVAQQNAQFQNVLERNKTADDNVMSGKWSADDAAAYKSGNAVEPSVEDRMGDIFDTISKAPTQQTVPTQESIIGTMKAKRVPVTSFGANSKLQMPDDGASGGNLPSTSLGPKSSNEFTQAMNAVGSKLNAFPDEQIGTDYEGSGATLQPVNIRGRYDREQGKTVETGRTAAGPTAAQKGTYEGLTAAGSEDLQRPGKVQTAVDTAQALQPVQIKTAAGEASARAHAQTQADVDRAVLTGGLLPEQVQPAMQLADDFRNESKDFFTINDSMRRMVKVGNQNTNQGDIGVIFAYMKMLDPTSSVREGEQATAQNSGTIPQSVIARYNALISGTGRLDPEVKQNFMRAAASIYSAAKIDQDKRVQDYTGRANQFKVPANLVVREPAPGLDQIGKTVMLQGRPHTVVDIDAQGNAVLQPVTGGK